MTRKRPWATNTGSYGGGGLARSSGENECFQCGEDIEEWSQATKQRGKWIHKVCAPGGSDE